MWTNITHRGHDYALGDEVRITVQPGDEIYEGFLNLIDPKFIVLVGTGVKIAGFEDHGLGFPLASISRMEPL